MSICDHETPEIAYMHIACIYIPHAHAHAGGAVVGGDGRRREEKGGEGRRREEAKS